VGISGRPLVLVRTPGWPRLHKYECIFANAGKKQHPYAFEYICRAVIPQG
jgi:hypothetical protein